MNVEILKTETILFVRNQQESCCFYSSILNKEPELNVPGMTEFVVSDSFKIGLMPNDNISRIFCNKINHPQEGSGIPRCELYFTVNDIQKAFENAIQSGALLLSPIMNRDWGDKVCYFSDPDGHIIAFAEKIIS